MLSPVRLRRAGGWDVYISRADGRSTWRGRWTVEQLGWPWAALLWGAGATENLRAGSGCAGNGQPMQVIQREVPLPVRRWSGTVSMLPARRRGGGGLG